METAATSGCTRLGSDGGGGGEKGMYSTSSAWLACLSVENGVLSSSTGLWLRCREMRLSLARERERGLATASLSGARMMSLFSRLSHGG